MPLSERQKAIVLDEFEQSCESWYAITQDGSTQENLQNNYSGRQRVGKIILEWSTMDIPEALSEYRKIKDELAKIEIKKCQKYHDCMPPLRDLYPASEELQEWIEENYAAETD